MPCRSTLPLLAGAALTAATPAAAIDRFEIQVYDAEINEPGQAGVELHVNYTADGERAPAYPGEVAPHHTARFTLEPAIGVTSWLELGAYLLAYAAPSEGFNFGGAKLRAKFVAPRLEEHFFLGVNVELGRVTKAVEEEGWANEIRPILGFTNDWVLFSVNPIIGTTLSGPDKFRFDFEPAAKLAVNTQLGFALGVEWYGELGFVDAIRPLPEQAHYLFGVFDLVPAPGAGGSPWELNVAVGGGISGPTDQSLLVKTIVGRSF